MDKLEQKIREILQDNFKSHYEGDKQGIPQISYWFNYNEATTEILEAICGNKHYWIYDNKHGVFGDGVRTCNICGKKEKHKAIAFKTSALSGNLKATKTE